MTNTNKQLVWQRIDFSDKVTYEYRDSDRMHLFEVDGRVPTTIMVPNDRVTEYINNQMDAMGVMFDKNTGEIVKKPELWKVGDKCWTSIGMMEWEIDAISQDGQSALLNNPKNPKDRAHMFLSDLLRECPLK